jgi:hypothetical protein
MLPLLLLLIGAPRAEDVVDPGLRWAQVQQQELPALSARQESAEARTAAARAYFGGEIPLEQAWPRYLDAPLSDPSFLAARVQVLVGQGRDRAAERVAPAPDVGRYQGRYLAQLGATLDAEEAADVLELRLLGGLAAAVVKHPELAEAELDRTRASQALARSALVEELEAADGDEDALRRLALLDEEIASFEASVRLARRAATVPGTVVSIEPDLPRLQDRELAEQAALRLLLLRPFVRDTEQLDQALGDWFAQQPILEDWSPPTGTRAELQAELDRVDALLASLQLRADELAPSEGEARPSDLGLRSARHGVVVREIEAWSERRETLAEVLAQAEDVATVPLEEAEAARQAAELARSQAKDDAGRLLATQKEAAAQSIEDAQKLRGQVEAETGRYAAQIADFRDELAALEDRAAALKSTPPLTQGRDEQASELYTELGQLITDLRDAALQRPERKARGWAEPLRSEHSTARESLRVDRAAVEVETAELAEAFDQREQALKAMSSDVDRRVKAATDHEAAVLGLLGDAKLVRRDIREEVPRGTLLQEDAVGEALAELSLLVPNVWSLGRARVESLVQWPDLAGLLTALRGVLGLLFALVVWRFARGRAKPVIETLVQRSAEAHTDRLRRAEIEGVAAPATPVMKALLDVSVVWLLLGPAMERLPELGMVLLVYWQFAMYRLLTGLYGLLVARPAERRASLIVVARATWGLGERTVQWLLVWGIARKFVSTLCLEILAVDAIHALAMRVFAVLLVLVGVRLLHLWEPTLRRWVARHGDDNPLRAWLTSVPKRPVLTSWLRALIDLVLLGISSGWNFVQGRAGERSTLGRLLNVFYRYRLGEKESPTEVEPNPLPDELHVALQGRSDPDAHIERVELDRALYVAVRRWQKEARQGAMALISDRGSGSSTWLDQICQELADEGQVLTRFSLDHRVIDEEGLCLFLSRSLGMEPAHSVEQVVEALGERPSGVLVFEGAHRAFLRTVGGFEALRALLEILGSTSDRHFWVVGFHKPAWQYLSRLGHLLKVHLFRDVLELAALTEAELRELVVKRTAAAGYEVDFSNLVRRGALSGDAEGELERATVAFFRVLGEASYGNPTVALQLWCESLVPGEGRVLQVRLGQAVHEARVEGLSEPELFALAALRLQDGLTEGELARVNNTSPSSVRASLQLLSGRGLVARGALEVWGLMPRQLAAVTRTLVVRNLMEWS